MVHKPQFLDLSYRKRKQSTTASRPKIAKSKQCLVASAFVTAWSSKRYCPTKRKAPLAVAPGGNEFYREYTFKNPILWQGKENPYLYTVEVTLKGPGSNDPNKPAERGSLEVSLHVQPWSATIVYDEVI